MKGRMRLVCRRFVCSMIPIVQGITIAQNYVPFSLN